MSHAVKISHFIDEQLPDFIQEDAPLFADFLEAYYDYMEQSGNALEQLRSLAEYQDIDSASESFIDFFFQEISKELPDNIQADRTILVKNAKQLYRAKGSKNAYKFLFRFLYNSDVDLVYPGEKILRASDGRFDTQTTLRVDLTLNGNSLDGIEGETIIGSTNGGRAIVESVETQVRGGVTVFVLSLSNVTGTFEDQEPFTVVNSTITGTVNSDFGPLADISVIDGGAQHRAGDLLNIVSTQGVGTGGTARVATVTDKSAITFRVVSGGSGYRANVVYSTTQGGGKIIPAIEGGTGQGASFRVVSITDTENLNLNTDIIAGLSGVDIGSSPFSSDPDIGDDVNPTLAASDKDTALNSALTFSSSGTIGAIDEIELIDPGFGYTELPTITPVDHIVQEEIGTAFPDDTGVGGIKGANAVIVANNLFGAISTVTIVSEGSAYNKSNVVELRNQTSANTFLPTGNPVPTGISDTVGVYTDSNRGILGGDNVLQDNFYFQEYSYVVKSKVGLDQYKSIVDNLLHPAGTKLFATQVIEIPVTTTEVQVVSNAVEKQFDAIQIQTVLPEVIVQVDRRFDVQLGPAELPAVTFTEAEVDLRIVFGVNDGIASTAVVTEGTNTPTGGQPDEIEFIIFVEDVTIAPTSVVAEPEVQLTISEAGAIASTVALSTDAELQLSIEEVTIAPTTTVSTDAELVLFIEPDGFGPTAFIAGDVPIEPFQDVVIGASPNTYGDDVNFAAEDQAIYEDFVPSDENSRIGDALGLHRVNPLVTSQSIDPTVAFGTAEAQLTIEDAGAIAPTVAFGDVGNIEVQLTIEDVTIASTLVFGGENPIEPMRDVELNQNPFSTDPDIGALASTELAGSNINTTLNDALKPIVVSSA